MFWEKSVYDQLTRAVLDFEFGTRAFRVSIGTDENKQICFQSEEREMNLLVGPDAHMKNVTAKTDTLANQLANLILILKKGHDP